MNIVRHNVSFEVNHLYERYSSYSVQNVHEYFSYWDTTFYLDKETGEMVDHPKISISYYDDDSYSFSFQYDNDRPLIKVEVKGLSAYELTLLYKNPAFNKLRNLLTSIPKWRSVVAEIIVGDNKEVIINRVFKSDYSDYIDVLPNQKDTEFGV